MSKNILVVDDEKEGIDLLDAIISNVFDNITIKSAGNGIRALEILRQEKCDLVITDTIMPKMNGIELIKVIRADDNLKDIPIIAASGISGNRAKIMRAGADAFFAKPFDLDELITKIKELLNPQTKEE